jgi:lipid-A-disaccharide synthase
VSDPRPLKIAFVAGEDSGDLLGADLIQALRALHIAGVNPVGIGGIRMQALGLRTLFDPHEIALMGVTAVLKKLPRLLGLIKTSATAIARENPDCLVIIDSPDFTHRIARRVRQLNPDIPIVNYVCPSIWAWRSGRAKAMTAFIDEVLTILPFEAASLQALSGPPATYVGHPLANDAAILASAKAQAAREADRFADWQRPMKLLCLPGSRQAVMQRHAEVFCEILAQMKARGRQVEVIVPTTERLRVKLETLTAAWPFPARLAISAAERAAAFSEGDMALASSGTATLELALCGVPMVSIYQTDWLMRLARPMIRIWTASLPNLIADQVIVPEFINEMIRPGHIARQLEMLGRPGAARDAQLQGFELVREKLAAERPSGELAAGRVLAAIEKYQVRSVS